MKGLPVDLRSDLRHPRRLVTAVALFVLLAAVPVAVGGVTESDLLRVDDLPETFQVAPPHEGDQVVYQTATYRRDGETYHPVQPAAEAFRFTHRFLWVPLEGEWQRLHEVQKALPVACTVNGQDSAGYRSSLFATDGTPVGHGEACDNRATPVEERPEGWGDRVLAQVTERLEMTGVGTVGAAHECLHVHAFQQRAVPLGDLDGLFDACIFEFADADGARRAVGLERLSPFEALGTTPFGTEQALVVEASEVGLVDPVTVQWWFVPSVPYPVQVALEVPAQDHVQVYTLERFHRGTPPAPSPPPDPASMQQQPWDFAGPAEADIEHPFPLSAALAAADEEPGFEEYHAYRRAHPDAVVQWAHYEVDEDRDTRHTWGFALSDGAEPARFQVTLTITRPELGLVGETIGQAPPEGAPEYRFDAGGEMEGYAWYAPSQLPPVPPVPTLAARYRTMTGEEANSWGMRPCAPACDGAGHELTIGRAFTITEPHWGQTDLLVPSGKEETMVFDQLVLSPDGSFRAWERRIVSDQYGPGAAAPSDDPHRFDDGFVALASDTVVVWRVPAAVATASVLVALSVALGYWLWPLAKLGPAALFSRVQKDRLLENPHRQAIMQAITAEPGIHHRRLARTLGLPTGTLKHHLDKLCEGRLVVAKAGGGHTCYFVRGEVDRRTMDAAGALKSPVARGLVAAARSEADLTLAEAARRLGVRPPTILHHVARLERAGLIRRVKDGGTVRLEAVDGTSASPA